MVEWKQSTEKCNIYLKVYESQMQEQSIVINLFMSADSE